MRIIMPAMPVIALVAILAHSANQQFVVQQRATSYVSAHPWCQAYWADIQRSRVVRTASRPNARQVR